MQIKYNISGDRRKAMVAVMRDVLQDTTRYLGAPSYAFQAGKLLSHIMQCDSWWFQGRCRVCGSERST